MRTQSLRRARTSAIWSGHKDAAPNRQAADNRLTVRYKHIAGREHRAAAASAPKTHESMPCASVVGVAEHRCVAP